ncbi:MAG: UpxY family transcription antiterminator [Odoribacter sp.]
MENVFSWYAVYTASRAEKKVKERLDQTGIENYLPLRTEVRVWCDRKKKITLPLIAGYIFVRVKTDLFISVLNTSGVVAFLKEKGKAVAIPDIQIERLRWVEKEIDEPIEISFEKIPKGTLVEIVRGKLTGFQGEMVRFRDKFQIVLRLEKLGCALITVPVSCIEKVKK